MTTTHTQTAVSHLQQAVQALRDALATSSAVESLALLDLIRESASLAHKSEALAQAMNQDDTQKTAS